MKKSWVIIKWTFAYAGKQIGDISIWETDEYQIWGSPAYEVLGYFDGSFKDAKKEVKIKHKIGANKKWKNI